MNPVKKYDKARYPPNGWKRRLVWIPPGNCICKHPDGIQCASITCGHEVNNACGCMCHSETSKKGT